MGSLSHTQIHWPVIIQTADIFGDYAISGLIMFVAACVARDTSLARRIAGVLAHISRGGTVLQRPLSYGHHRLFADHLAPAPPSP